MCVWTFWLFLLPKKITLYNLTKQTNTCHIHSNDLQLSNKINNIISWKSPDNSLVAKVIVLTLKNLNGTFLTKSWHSMSLGKSNDLLYLQDISNFLIHHKIIMVIIACLMLWESVTFVFREQNCIVICYTGKNVLSYPKRLCPAPLISKMVKIIHCYVPSGLLE